MIMIFPNLNNNNTFIKLKQKFSVIVIFNRTMNVML